MEKIFKRMDKTNEELGKLGLRFGEMVEHLVAAGVAERFNELGYHFHGISSGNFKAKDEKGETLAEVDVLLENDDCYVAVEVKAKPNMEDVIEQINRLRVLRQYFKKHNKEKRVIGALAGAIFADNVKKRFITRGLYPIVQSGDTITIDVPKNFKPRLF
jgi:predicted AAA+ superfamily ATPase